MTALMAPPARTPEQFREALAEANRVRMFRAQMKRDLKAGKVIPLSLLLDPPAELRTMKVSDFLLAIPSVGQAKVTRAFLVCRVSMVKTLGGLSPRQRDELSASLLSPLLRRRAKTGGER